MYKSGLFFLTFSMYIFSLGSLALKEFPLGEVIVKHDYYQDMTEATSPAGVSGIGTNRELEIWAELLPDGMIRISWNEIPEAYGYTVYHCDKPAEFESEDWQEMASFPAGVTEYVFEPLAMSCFYYVTYWFSSLPENFVLVEGGSFLIAPTSNYQAVVSSFYIDRYELTQPDYQSVMGSNPAYNNGLTGAPVEQVTWFDTIEYCNRRSLQEGLIPCYSYFDQETSTSYGNDPDFWPAGWNTENATYSKHLNVICDWIANGYRLPTEAEWMYAAKGGCLTPSSGYSNYSGSNTINSVAWYTSNSGGATHAVGTKADNELGNFDMSGNVFEWCWDVYGEYPIGIYNDPHGAESGQWRVRRGGSAFSGENFCRVYTRSSGWAINSSSSLGFRICRKAL